MITITSVETISICDSCLKALNKYIDIEVADLMSLNICENCLVNFKNDLLKYLELNNIKD